VETGRKEEAMSEGQWEQVGEVGIDSGTLALVDPVYAETVSAAEGLEATDTGGVGTIRPQGAVRDLGVIVSTGLGDGMYPVEVRYEEAEGSQRIAEVRVRFLPHPILGYELPR
jgi:hypothetical protein